MIFRSAAPAVAILIFAAVPALAAPIVGPTGLRLDCTPHPGQVCDSQITGGSVGQSQSLDGNFVSPSPGNVFGPGATATALGYLGGSNFMDIYTLSVNFSGTYIFDIDSDSLDESLRGDFFLTIFQESVKRPGSFPIAWSDDAGLDPGSDSSYVDPFVGSLRLDDFGDPDFSITYYIFVTNAFQYPLLLETTPVLRDLARPDGGPGGYRLNTFDTFDVFEFTNLSQLALNSFNPGQSQVAGAYNLHVTRLDDPMIAIVDPEPGTCLLVLGGDAVMLRRSINRRISERS